MDDKDNKIIITDSTDIEPMEANPPIPSNVRPITVSDMINMCNEAASKMSVHNDNRILLFNCAFALRQLVDRLAMQEGEVQ